jgi:catalase
MLLQDFNHFEHMTAFDRERVPERVVHANGHGYETHMRYMYTASLHLLAVHTRTHLMTKFTIQRISTNISSIVRVTCMHLYSYSSSDRSMHALHVYAVSPARTGLSATLR